MLHCSDRAKTLVMANQLDTTTRRRIFLIAGAADLHPETARALVEGKPVARKTRDALVRARTNLDTIKDELAATLEQLTNDDTATNGGAT